MSSIPAARARKVHRARIVRCCVIKLIQRRDGNIEGKVLSHGPWGADGKVGHRRSRARRWSRRRCCGSGWRQEFRHRRRGRGASQEGEPVYLLDRPQDAEVIVGRGDICVRQPGRGGGGVDVSAAIGAGRSLIESNDKKRVFPVRAGGDQGHERLKKSIALRGRPVVHVVGHIRDHHDKVGGRIEIRERLNVGALGGVQSDAFEGDDRIVFPDVLPGKTWTIHSARACRGVRASAGKVLSKDAP